jgi:4-hydroxybenzoate polyprenyltransferase
MSRPSPSVLLRALRPAQWTKNALVLAAFVFALGDRQQHLDLSAFWMAVQAALLFCLASSGVYLLNDVKDRPWDRLHPTKKLRPVASGELGVGPAVILAVVLLAAALGGAWFWLRSPRLAGVIGAYVALQVVYNLGLKRVALVDLFVIALGFVLRALAGAVALNVAISPWLLLCTLLLALFLALCKRRHEKVVLADLGDSTRPSLADYDERLLDQLIAMVSSATLVCYALYTLWPDTVTKFNTHRLGLTIPFVIFGLFRYLDLVYRHEKGGQPERILLTDVPLIVNIGLYALTVLAVVMGGRAF